MEIKIQNPLEMDFDLLLLMKDIIGNLGEVKTDNLFNNLLQCARICTIWEEENLIAFGAIKCPPMARRKDIMTYKILWEKGFEKTNLENIHFELGYLHVKEEWRQRGLSRLLNENLLSGAKHPIYTTIRENHLFLEKNLLQNGFKKAARFPSILKPELSVFLYIR